MLEYVLISLIVFLIILVLVIGFKYSKLKTIFSSELDKKISQVKEYYEKVRAEFIESKPKDFENWKKEESNKMKKEFEEWKEQSLNEAVQLRFEEWRQRYEANIRKDAIKSSVATIIGKITEHIAPLYLVKELEVDPRDIRFIGTPIDFIAFKGLSQGRPEKIFFIEVKTSKAGSLTQREKAIRDLVESKMIEWVTFNLREELSKAISTSFEEIEKIEYKTETTTPAIMHVERKENEEFYSWLKSEFNIVKEEYFNLDGELKDIILKEFRKKLKS